MTSAAALLDWYDRHRRDLPWRRSRDPYRVWLSEIMLQQTRVETATPYYERFLERFPDVETLAAAPLEEVLALWSGLGYYRRARQLHAAAGRLAEKGFPRTAAGWRELPGVGAYTSAAVASIAFGEAVPVLDGNVERVTGRLLAVDEPPKRAAVRRRLGAAAAALLDPERPGDSNQALMELGATVCTPRRPKCPLCPLAGDCRAAAEGDPERYPAKGPRRRLERQVRRVALAERDGRHLLFRRADGEELLAGLWELPWVELSREAALGEDGPGEPGAADDAVAAALAERYGGRWRLGPRLGTVRHGITFRALELEVVAARVSGRAGGGVAEPGDGGEAGWFSRREIEELPTSSMVAKVLELVEEG